MEYILKCIRINENRIQLLENIIEYIKIYIYIGRYNSKHENKTFQKI